MDRDQRGDHVSPSLLVAALLLGCTSSTPRPEPGPATTTEPADGDAPAPAGEPTAATAEGPVTIDATYTGRVSLPLPGPGEPVAGPSPMIIRDGRSLAQLISMIPRNKIQKKQPAPPSDDPLLGKPDIDFESKMVVAVFRSDTMYVHPKLDNARVEGDKLIIDVTHPPLGDTAMAAAQEGIGTYCAIVIDAFAGKIELNEQ